ncbi:MAG: ribonuclease E/G [Lachnospiraceae bacterium]|nr:ribonuclease E/G [Lachnospiraceae bacterium]
MSNTLVLTHSKQYNKDLCLTYQDGKITDISCVNDACDSLVGNIYIGRVRKLVKNIEAAFIEIADGKMCYYEPEPYGQPIFIFRQSPNKLCEGDTLLVQVTKDAYRTKRAVVSSNLTFTSKYVVLTSGNTRMSMSTKLSASDKERLSKVAALFENEDFGLIIRTNAAYATDAEIIDQVNSLKDTYKRVVSDSMHKNPFVLVYQGIPDYLGEILGKYEDIKPDKIVTDNRDYYDKIKDFLSTMRPEFLNIITFYEDPYELNKLYGIDSDVEKALSSKVWLKSGAYLVIETTEAMTVIDVNSGKYNGKKKGEETYLKINKEAATEIARQLRLRNIAGICMVDFIDMSSKAAEDELMDYLAKEVYKDPIKTVVVDMTKLGLVEITRKRIRKSLAEQLSKGC